MVASLAILRYFPLLLRTPSLPLECFHGNWYSNEVEVVREKGVIAGLKLHLMADGAFALLLN